MAQELDPVKPQAMMPSSRPASKFSLPSEAAKVLEDNGPMMFPETGPSYRAGWSPPKTITSALAERLPGLLRAAEHALLPASAETALLHLNKLALHYWQADRPASHFKSLVADYLLDLAHVPPDILEAGVAEYRRTAEWFPKVSQLLAIMNPMVEQRKRETERLRRLMVSQKDGGTTTADTERRGKRWSEMTDEEKAAHDKRMAEIGGPKPIGDVLQQQAKGATDA